MPKPTNQDVRDVIIAAYTQEKLGIQSIAARLKIAPSTVHRVLVFSGIERSRETRVTGRSGLRLFNEATEREVAKRYLSGEGYNSLMAAYGCSHDAIRTALRRQGVKTRNRGNSVRSFTEEQAAEMADRWRRGQSQAEIGRAFNAHQTVVSRVLAIHGYKTEARRPRGDTHGAWKGGRTLNRGGYVWVRVERDGPFASMQNTGGYVLEHRLVVAQSLGRPLTPKETVHHINGARADNRLENLQLRLGPHGKHGCYQCADCGSRNIISVSVD